MMLPYLVLRNQFGIERERYVLDPAKLTEFHNGYEYEDVLLPLNSVEWR